MELMEAVWTPAVARVREEVADMQAIADKEGAERQDRALGLPLLRREGAQGEVRPRRERGEAVPPAREAARGHVLGGRASSSASASRPVTGVPVYHPDVRVWEVKDAPGKHVGLWYFDPYARPGKRSGAWMNAYRNQERFDGEVTDHRLQQLELREGHAGRAGADQLGRRRDAVPRVRPRPARPELERRPTRRSPGTTVARDYVEFPSQLLEHWLSTPEVLNRFALHYQTGKPIPRGAGREDRAGARPSTRASTPSSTWRARSST